MIELAQHIEVLLLENDCVIVPGLGGFVAHYAPAMRVAEENTFFAPYPYHWFQSAVEDERRAAGAILYGCIWH